MTWLQTARAVEASEDIARLLFGRRIRISKAKLNPVDRDGFAAIIADLAEKLYRIAAPEEEKALLQAMNGLNLNWYGLTDAQKDRAIANAMGVLTGAGKAIAPKVGSVFEAAGRDIVLGAKEGTKARDALRITPTFDAVNEVVIAHAAASQAFYIRNQYGEREAGFSAVARKVVAHGMEQGLDYYDIGRDLKSTLAGTSAERSEAYYRMIASVFSARSRTYGTAASFEEAGIDGMEWVSTLDEVTTNTCRFMHGKIIGSRATLRRFEDVASSPDPEAVKDLQPFASTSRDEDGQYLYYKQGEKRVQIARIEKSGVGNIDDVGSYSKAMGKKDLEASGISPPAHGFCRSDLVPAGDSGAVQVPANAPFGPVGASSFADPPVKFIDVAPGASPPGYNGPVAPLPSDLAALVRPLPGRTVSPDTAPTPTEAALEKLALLPKSPNAWSMQPDLVLHGIKTISPKADGTVEFPYEDTALDKKKMAGAKKQKPKQINLADITMLTEDVSAQHVQFALTNASAQTPLLVKTGGKLYSSRHMFLTDGSIVAAHLRGDTTIDAKVIDLDKVAKPKKPKVSTPPQPQVQLAPPPPTLSADVILHEQFGSAKGSNKGGFYRGKDGVERYVKFYDDPSQAYGEHLANQLYRDLGHLAPTSHVFEHDGRLAYASNLVKGRTLHDAGLNKARATDFMKGFVADVVTGNWDALGASLDNAMVTDAGIMRIDNGGTFLMRAQAGRKPAAALTSITEWQNFFAPMNPSYSRVAREAGVTSPKAMREQVIEQIERVKAVERTAGGWGAYVESIAGGMKSSDKATITGMLEAKTRLLSEKIATLMPRVAGKPTPEPERPAEKPFNMFDTSSPVARSMAQKIATQEDRPDETLFKRLFKRGGLSASESSSIQGTVSGWTSGYKDSTTQKAVYAAYESILAGKRPTTTTGVAVAKAKETRKTRWKALLEEVGHADAEVPKYLDLHRGMKGVENVVSVAKAWADEKAQHVTLETYAAASWSHRVETAEKFAHNAGANGPAVRFRWMHCPMEQTLFDQAVDDSTFLSSFYSEHEVVAGPGHKKGLDLPKHDHVVYYNGRAFTYNDRDELIDALQDDGHL